jgi:hypothetical protein
MKTVPMSLRRNVATARQKRELAVLQAPTYVKWDTEVSCTCYTCGPVKIEYTLLHPAVNGATLATLCENRAKDNPQNWWAVWGVEVKPPGTTKFNALSRNDYSTLVPGYLSLRSIYSTIHRMVPNPNKVLHGPVENEKYELYIAIEGRVPKQSSDTGAGFDYYGEESDMEEVNATIGYYTDHSRRGKRSRSGTISEDIRKSVRITEEWLFDSGATVHVTPNNTCY